MTLENHASLDRHLSLKDIARGIANDWNPSEEACAEAERIWFNIQRMRPGEDDEVVRLWLAEVERLKRAAILVGRP